MAKIFKSFFKAMLIVGILMLFGGVFEQPMAELIAFYRIMAIGTFGVYALYLFLVNVCIGINNGNLTIKLKEFINQLYSKRWIAFTLLITYLFMLSFKETNVLDLGSLRMVLEDSVFRLCVRYALLYGCFEVVKAGLINLLRQEKYFDKWFLRKEIYEYELLNTNIFRTTNYELIDPLSVRGTSLGVAKAKEE
ncbi:hypothetical protein [Vagococcus xieshaowenii]|uniref:Uncharacterized protein n=1 Tax=Vagococcus xieshaowenii TaxID=2562451 RepID=A0AAJ5EFL8_9ENTE|nr:hypothetical protein [Vagococcus xieshaowenii]QCA29672.1 hypothetical protein E4Z98_09810 [Vagococcus xieshaowenii]TFZ42947.1 hypothetical protein E4031_01550 [Vagococcus xieshaowenii]